MSREGGWESRPSGTRQWKGEPDSSRDSQLKRTLRWFESKGKSIFEGERIGCLLVCRCVSRAIFHDALGCFYSVQQQQQGRNLSHAPRPVSFCVCWLLRRPWSDLPPLSTCPRDLWRCTGERASQSGRTPTETLKTRWVFCDRAPVAVMINVVQHLLQRLAMLPSALNCRTQAATSFKDKEGAPCGWRARSLVVALGMDRTYCSVHSCSTLWYIEPRGQT